MDMEAGKTLTNEDVIRELLELLKKNAMKEQANDVFEICSYVDGLEKKIDSMTEELTNMQNQIKEMQTRHPRSAPPFWLPYPRSQAAPVPTLWGIISGRNTAETDHPAEQ